MNASKISSMDWSLQLMKKHWSAADPSCCLTTETAFRARVVFPMPSMPVIKTLTGQRSCIPSIKTSLSSASSFSRWMSAGGTYFGSNKARGPTYSKLATFVLELILISTFHEVYVSWCHFHPNFIFKLHEFIFGQVCLGLATLFPRSIISFPPNCTRGGRRFY